MLPNIVRFNISVQHDGASNAPAYDVKLKDGSKFLGIRWTSDRIGPGPTDPELSIYNDGTTWTWSETWLGKLCIMFFLVMNTL